MNRQRSGVFISYSRNDSKWLDQLRVHLKFLEKEYQFVIWDDTQITPGSDWRQEITQAIASAKVALLFVSAHFLSSDFITEEELPPLLSAAKEEGALIYPLIVSHCMFLEIPSLSKFQTVNQVSKPLVEMEEGERDALFVKVTKDIRTALLAEANHLISPKTTKRSGVHRGTSIFKLSVARASVLYVLSKDRINEQGLSITEIKEKSKIRSRKNVNQSIREMESTNLVIRNEIGKRVYWKLSEKGEKLADELGASIIFE